MALVADPGDFVNGTTADAVAVNNRIRAIEAQLGTTPSSYGNLDETNLVGRILARLGITGQGSTRSGKSIIAGLETYTGTGYGLMPTPDRISAVVVPADAVVSLRFRAEWSESVAAAARAAIFIGANQLQSDFGSGPVTEAAAINSASAGSIVGLASCPFGLVSDHYSSSGVVTTDDVTTGQALAVGNGGADGVAFERNGVVLVIAGPIGLGGACEIFGLPAGTYDFSVQFKASSGNVSAKNRKLWVEARAYV